MMRLIRKLFCRHKEQTFVRNIYAEEIIRSGYKRSKWKCNNCGKYLLHSDLKRGVDGCPD